MPGCAKKLAVLSSLFIIKTSPPNPLPLLVLPPLDERSVGRLFCVCPIFRSMRLLSSAVFGFLRFTKSLSISTGDC